MELYRVHGDWNNGAETWDSDAVYDRGTAERIAKEKARQFPRMTFSLVPAGVVQTTAAEGWHVPAEVQP